MPTADAPAGRKVQRAAHDVILSAPGWRSRANPHTQRWLRLATTLLDRALVTARVTIAPPRACACTGR